MLDDVHVYDGYCRHCHNKREDRMERELTRLRRVETVARAALANGNVHNVGSDDADALQRALAGEGVTKWVGHCIHNKVELCPECQSFAQRLLDTPEKVAELKSRSDEADAIMRANITHQCPLCGDVHLPKTGEGES